MREPQMNFDTHKHIEFLMGRGLKKAQAEAIVEVINQSRGYDFSNLATKDQVSLVEVVLRGEMKEMKEELKGEIQSAKYETLKWIIPFLIGIILTIFFKH